MRSHLLVLLLVSAALAGCVGPGAGDADLEPAATDAPILVMDLPIHVVAVGFDEFDGEQFLEQVGPHTPPFASARSFITGAVDPEPIQYDVEYVVHRAPDAFADELFAYAASIAVPDRPDPFIEDYDRQGEHRICPQDEGGPVALPGIGSSDPPCEDVRRIDAAAIDRWLAENREAHGLEFPGPGYTVFLLDHHSQAHLSTDTYHRYAVDAPPSVFQGADRMRAWVGDHDFLFLDVSAGPNAYDFTPWSTYDRTNGWVLGQEDRPIWDVEDDSDAFYENLGRNLRDATNRLWTPTPDYATVHADRYLFPFYVFIDPNAHANPDSPLYQIDPMDIPSNTDEDAVLEAFQSALPWAEVEVEFHYIYLPEDDPAMHEAVEDARQRHTFGTVDKGVLKKHLNGNWDRYVDDAPGTWVLPTFAFWVDFPGTWTYGWAEWDAWGDAWGVYINVGDSAVCVRPGVPVCTVESEPPWSEDWWDFWNMLIIHEPGHALGLNHPSLTAGLDDDDYHMYEVNRLWDSTTSTMGYRHWLVEFSAVDKDFILRHHAAHVAADVLRDSSATSEARGAADAATGLLQEGRYLEALKASREARALMGEPGVLEPPGPRETVRGETWTTVVDIPAGDSVGVPQTGLPPILWSVPLPTGDLARAAFPVDIPEGAEALEVEYEEADRPSHTGWAAFATVVNAEGDVVAGLWNNAHEKVVLRALDRCDSGCTGYVYGYGGAAMTYDVSLTPLYPTGSEDSA